MAAMLQMEKRIRSGEGSAKWQYNLDLLAHLLLDRSVSLPVVLVERIFDGDEPAVLLLTSSPSNAFGLNIAPNSVTSRKLKSKRNSLTTPIFYL